MKIKVSGFTPTTSKQNVLAGKTLQLGVAVKRQVRVYSRATGVLLASTFSNVDGEFKIYIPIDLAYTIVAIDSLKLFNAVIQDNVVPK